MHLIKKQPNIQVIYLSIIALTLFIMNGCSTKRPALVNSNQPIQIGVIAPLTGKAAELGQHIQRGLELAHQKLNVGNQYNLIYEDDKCTDTKLALSAAQKIIQLDKAKYVIGPLCAPAYQSVSGVFNANQISFIHTSGVTPSFVNSSGDLGIPGLTTTIYQENKALAEFIHKKLRIQKMAVFVWNEEWAVEHGRGFTKSFTDLGGEIVFDEKFTLDDSDFRTSIIKIQRSDAQGVFIVALNFQNAEIVKQVRDLDQNIKIFGQFEIEDPAFLKPASSSAEDIIYVYPKIDQTNPETKKFIESYQQLYGSQPNYYVYIGYDSLKIYDWAIRQCQDGSPQCVTDTILSAKDFPGVSGLITFNPDKTLSRQFIIKTIQDGQPVEYK